MPRTTTRLVYQQAPEPGGGALLTQLFSQSFVRLIRDIKISLNKMHAKGAWRTHGDFHTIATKDTIHRFLRPTIITKALRNALSTGNLGARGTTNLVGTAQVLNRLSFNGTLSHLRRVLSPLGTAGKIIAPRSLHPTQIFGMCPAETPEGQSVGLVKNLALATRVSMYSAPGPPSWSCDGSAARRWSARTTPTRTRMVW